MNEMDYAAIRISSDPSIVESSTAALCELPTLRFEAPPLYTRTVNGGRPTAVGSVGGCTRILPPSCASLTNDVARRLRNQATVCAAVANQGVRARRSRSRFTYASSHNLSGPRLRSCQLIVRTPPNFIAFSISGRMAASACSSDRFIYEG